ARAWTAGPLPRAPAAPSARQRGSALATVGVAVAPVAGMARPIVGPAPGFWLDPLPATGAEPQRLRLTTWSRSRVVEPATPTTWFRAARNVISHVRIVSPGHRRCAARGGEAWPRGGWGVFAGQGGGGRRS